MDLLEIVPLTSFQSQALSRVPPLFAEQTLDSIVIKHVHLLASDTIRGHSFSVHAGMEGEGSSKCVQMRAWGRGEGGEAMLHSTLIVGVLSENGRQYFAVCTRVRQVTKSFGITSKSTYFCPSRQGLLQKKSF